MSSSETRTCLGGILVLLLFLVPRLATAQELEITVSPSPVGSGARAAGMADAFVAIADDATAASWNPAGLARLQRPELSVVGSYLRTDDEFSSCFHPEANSRHREANEDLNYLSFVYPLPFLVLDRNVVVSLNYQRKHDFSRRFHLRYNSATATTFGTVFSQFQGIDFEQDGGLSAITPAVGFELTDRLYAGVALNFWRSSFLSDNDWEQTLQARNSAFWGGNVTLTSVMLKEEYRDFSGENFTIGLLWKINPRWTLGARYDTAFTGEADYRHRSLILDKTLPSPFFPQGSFNIVSDWQEETRHIRFPASHALGLAYRAGDRLTLAVDVTRTDWKDFWVKGADGFHYSLVNYGNLDDPFNGPSFDPTYTVRLGAEYVCLPKQPRQKLDHLWTLRGGLFYDEEPATGTSNTYGRAYQRGSGEPDEFYGLALGCGLLSHQRVNLDLAYQLRYGHDVNRDFVRGLGGFKDDVLQHRVLLSTVVYF